MSTCSTPKSPWNLASVGKGGKQTKRIRFRLPKASSGNNKTVMLDTNVGVRLDLVPVFVSNWDLVSVLV
jgi:hypothetical protein